MSENENADLIPPEDFAEAIAAFRANPDVDFMFTNAPQSAKLFLGLLFYKAHFRELADDAQIQACLADIEGSLDDESIAYLLDCDIEANTKAYLSRLRDSRKSVDRQPSPLPENRKEVTSSEKSEDRIDYNFEAIKKRLADKEAEAATESRKEAEIQAAIRRKKLVSAGLKAVAGLALLAAVAYGYVLWSEYREKRAAEVAESRRIEEERLRKEEEERALQRERQEAEAARRRKEQAELQEKRRLAYEKRKEQLEKERAEREARNKARVEENERKIREESARRERSDSLRESFRKAIVETWGGIDGETRRNVFAIPGCFLVPDDEEREGVLYEVRVAVGTNGIFRLSRYDGDKPVGRDAMTDILLKNGALYMAADKKVYCINPQHADGSRFSITGQYCYPAELLLEGVLTLMQRYMMDFGSLLCEVTYIQNDGEKERDRIRIGEVGLNQSLACSEMAERVTEILTKRKKPFRKNVRVKRATVVLYDGDIIKRGADGVTHVPRSPRGRIPSNYYRLYDEAKRQEAEREEAFRNAERAEDENRDRMQESVRMSFADRRISIRMISR